MEYLQLLHYLVFMVTRITKVSLKSIFESYFVLNFTPNDTPSWTQFPTPDANPPWTQLAVLNVISLWTQFLTPNTISPP